MNADGMLEPPPPPHPSVLERWGPVALAGVAFAFFLWLGRHGTHLPWPKALAVGVTGALLMDLGARKMKPGRAGMASGAWLTLAISVVVFFGIYWLVPYKAPSGAHASPWLAAMFAFAALLFGLWITLAKAGHNNWAKGGCLALVAAGFLVLGIRLAIFHLRGDASASMTIATFLTLPGAGFLFAAWRAVRSPEEYDPRVAKVEFLPFRFGGFFIVFISIWAALCAAAAIAMGVFAARHSGEPGEWMPVIGAVTFLLLGPGLLAWVLWTNHRSRGKTSLRLTWIRLSEFSDREALRGELRLDGDSAGVSAIRADLLPSPVHFQEARRLPELLSQRVVRENFEFVAGEARLRLDLPLSPEFLAEGSRSATWTLRVIFEGESARSWLFPIEAPPA